jgi:hypothetical protein
MGIGDRGEHSMASNEYVHGTMDISAHKDTWGGFVALVKWSCIGLAVFLVAMRFLLIGWAQ